MSEAIFATEAPKYFARGLSVTPLVKGLKKPVEDNWTYYKDKLPPQDVQEQWIHQYSHGNIGLVLGPQSGLIAIDIDTTDDKLVKAIESVLPPSPWVRIGQRGYVKVYKYGGQRLKHIKDKNGVGIVDILSSGSQIVLPPSIHPDTQKPYVENVSLLDVLDQVLPIDKDIYEKLVAALRSAGVEIKESSGKNFSTINFVSAGSRDNEMTLHAGLLASEVRRGMIPLKRAMENMISWCENYVEQVAGDEIDVNKGVAHIVNFLLRDMQKHGAVLRRGWDEGLSDEEKEAWGLKFNEDQQEWSADEIIKFLNGVLALDGDNPNSKERMEAIEVVLQRIHQSPSLTSLEVDKILTYMSKNAGNKIPVSSYRKRLRELAQGEGIAGINHTEIAEAAIEEFEAKIGMMRFDKEEFWRWGGSHWQPVEFSEIERIISMDFGHLDAAKKYGDISGIRKTMRNLVKQGVKTIDICGVNFANGVLTSDLKLVPHNPDYGMLYTLPFRYVPDAPPPELFLKMLHTFWGHTEDYELRVQMLREAIAATIFSIGPSLGRAICLYGPGGTGKSQILDVMTFLVPPSAMCAIAPNVWDGPYTTSEFIGKLLNVCGELPERKLIDSQTFKGIITGDLTSAQRKFQAMFDFRPQAIHWFSTNNLPKSRDTSRGFNRRWLFIEFDKIIDKKDIVLDIGKKIGQLEIEQVATWAIQCVPELLKRGSYTESPSHLKLVEDMSLQNSNIRQFLKTMIEVKQDAVISEDSLFEKYYVFILGKLGGSAAPKKTFQIEFKQLVAEYPAFEKFEKDGQLWYRNMAVKTSAPTGG